MSTEKFTPGEWEFSLNEVQDGIFDHLEYHIWKCGENKSIVRFETWDKTKFAESKANAALIAAAPEMYRMLEDVKGDFKALSVNPNVSETVKANAWYMMNKIEALLKKARGEE